MMRKPIVSMRAAALSSAVIALASAAPVCAQSAASAAAEGEPAMAQGGASAEADSGEIVVTAQKRAENLREVPISITAMTGSDLTARGFTSAIDLPDLVPGVRSTTPGGGSYTTTIIRGIGQQDIALHQEAPVATYVDGAYVSLTTAQTQPIFDVNRVEVLKGPQGTLFGRNATGGLVHYVSRAPSETTEGYVTAEYGRFDKFMAEGAIGGSLGGNWTGRLAFHTETGGAFVHNPVGINYNGNTVYAGRAQLMYRPSSDFSLLFNLYGAKWPDQAGPALSSKRVMLDANGRTIEPPSFKAYQSFCQAAFGAAPTTPGPLGNCFFTITDPQNIPVENYQNFTGNYWSGTVTMEAKLGAGLELTSITNYQETQQDIFIPVVVGIPTSTYHNSNPKGKQVSQELRLAGGGDTLRWVVGGFGLHIDNSTFNDMNLFDVPGYGVSLFSPIHIKTDSVAGFAEATYSPSPEWSIILGGRVTWDRKHGVNASTCTNNPVINFDVCGAIAASSPEPLVAFAGFDKEFSNTTWAGRAVVQYKPNSDLMVFAGVNRGTKSGGFNTGVAELYPVSVAQFGGETLTNYEAGIKARLFDRLMNVNASAFYYDYKDFQTYSTVNTGLYVFNVDATVKGAELDVLITPMRGLELKAAGSYLETEQKHVPVGTGFGNFPIPGAPKFSFDGSIRYSFPLGDGKFSTMFTATHVDKRSTSAINNAAENIPGYERYDVRFSYEIGQVTAAFNIRNIGDTIIFNSRVPFIGLGGFTGDSLVPPRTYSGSITYRF